MENVSKSLNNEPLLLDQIYKRIPGFVYQMSFNDPVKVQFISEGFYELTGYRPKIFYERKALEDIHIVHPDDWPTFVRAVLHPEPGDEGFQIDYRIITKSGKIKWVTDVGTYIKNEKNTIIGWEGHVRDRSLFKKTETDREHFKTAGTAMVKALPDTVFILSKEGNYIDIHAPRPELLIRPKEELLGKNISDFLSEDICLKTFDAFQKLSQFGGVEMFEIHLELHENLKHMEARISLMDNGYFLCIMRDLTEIVSKDRTLADNQNRLKLAMAAGGFGYWEWNLKTNAINWDHIQEKLYGLNLKGDHTDAKRIENTIHPEDRKSFAKIIYEALKLKKSYTNEFRVKSSDYEYRWLFEEGTLFIGNDGEPERVIGVTKDITRRKRQEIYKDLMQAVLRDSIALKPLRLIMNKIVRCLYEKIPRAQVSIFLVDGKANRLRCISSVDVPQSFVDTIESLGIEKENGCNAKAVFLKMEVIEENVRNGKISPAYKEALLKDNLVSCWSFPILSSANEVLGTLAVYTPEPRKPTKSDIESLRNLARLANLAIERNQNSMELERNRKNLKQYAERLERQVTARTEELSDTVIQLVRANLDLEDQVQSTKEAERNALSSKELLSNVAKHFPLGGIAVVNRDMEFIFADGEEMEGVGIDTLKSIGKKISEMSNFSPERRKMYEINVKRTLTGEHLSVDVILGGTNYSINSTPLSQNGRITHALMVYNNITSQKKAEVEMNKTLKREQALSEMKSRFISMASHEFRTPLSSILTSTTLIEKQNGAGQEDKRLNAIDRIRSNVQNLVVILNDFLSLGKIQEGKLTIKKSLFDMVSFCRELVEEARDNMKPDQKIEYIVVNEPITLSQDEKLLRHVLQNLLSNAIKYSEEGDTISLKLGKDGDLVYVEVADKGIGIPEEEQENLFGRFFRAENSINIQGTGLGLHIVKQYVQLIGGRIDFSSELNVGSTFRIEIPAKPKKGNEKSFADRRQ